MKTYVGKNENGLSCFICWELKDGRFSATAHYVNRAGTDYDSCGQILDDILNDFPENDQVQRIWTVWQRWHLNDMRAGSPRQQAVIEGGIRDDFEKYKKQVEEHNSKYYTAKQRLLADIKNKLWNQQDNPERLFDKLLKSLVIKAGIATYHQYLRPNEQVLTSGFGGDAPKRISVGYATAEILKKGLLKSPDWYPYVCQRLELLGLLLDSEYLVEKEVVIDGVTHKLNVAYKYGSKWLKEELPTEVVEEINSWIEVPFEEKTPIELLAEKWGAKLVYSHPDRGVIQRSHYILSLANGATFPYFCGMESDAIPEAALASVLRDAYAAKDGTELATEYFIEELGYEYKQAREIAKACYESYQKLEGLWDEEVEELASQI